MDKPSTEQLTKEATGIGVSVLVLFVLIHIIFMGINNDLAMSHLGIFLCAFLSGFLGHFAFEYMGWNRKFIEDRKSLTGSFHL